MSNLVISHEVLRQAEMTPVELRLEISIFLYSKKQLSFDQSQRLAGVEKTAFQEELKKRGLPISLDSGNIKMRLGDDNPKPAEGNSVPHFLADVIGAMDNASGEDLERIVSREFQEIEGEW